MNSSSLQKKVSRLQKLYMLNVPRFIDECWKDALIENSKKDRSTSPFSKFIPIIRRKMGKILLTQFS
ncbi:hypothetical protein Glove_103g210 [Diversispora epigaea]|uniref:Uncharacterized protein n=1 Tax=Diversispora epigaea TaxID=1348612 RepID=A0A397J3D0_9GLOM|nr:hypothetical protein Glove_103g210 [Diversispora epigaea]